jgi:carbon starvation protein
MPGTLISTGFIVFSWAYFIHTGNISSIWPMFGVANQLLASVALCVAATAIINSGKQKYVWVAMVPLAFVSVTTFSAGFLNITDNFLPMTDNPATRFQGYLNSLLTVIIMLCAAIILIDSARRWYRILVKKEYFTGGHLIYAPNGKNDPPEFGCC